MPDEPTPAEQPPKRVPCDQCLGCGKVDSRDKKSWRLHSKLPNLHPDVKARDAGEIVPQICPKCEGKGYTDGSEGKGLGLVPAKDAGALADLQKQAVEEQARKEFQADTEPAAARN